MADVIDIANDQAEYLLQLALHRRPRGVVSFVGAIFCEDCGVTIPEKRRIAIPGCETCIHCQERRERNR
jgi:phage/conjugal plasmid C-4 type zinc finger TraR family protein